MKKIILISLFFLSCAKEIKEHTYTDEAQVSEPKIVFVAGIISQNPVTKEWQVMEDPGHTSHNIDSVTTKGDHVIVSYKFVAKKVISFIAVGDEKYTEQGFLFGGQYGLVNSYLWYSKPSPAGFIRTSTNDAFVEGSNILIYGVFEI